MIQGVRRNWKLYNHQFNIFNLYTFHNTFKYKHPPNFAYAIGYDILKPEQKN